VNSNHASTCIELDDALLPQTPSAITNDTIEGTMAIEHAFSDAHELTNTLPIFAPVPEPMGKHGEWFDNNRYCVCCDALSDGFNNPTCCPGQLCGAPWERTNGDES
jgi:hypothetical protein